MNTYFVIGTNTKIDKTITSCALLQAAGQLGLRAVGYKPVASGSGITAEDLRNSDALALQRNGAVTVDYAAINPCTFAEPAPPHIISADKGRLIRASVMSAGLRLLGEQADWVLAEGTDGWFTPLLSALSFSDQVKTEQLPVALVIGIKLGCVNHTVLTAQAVQQTGLTLAGQVANDVMSPGKRHARYMATLKHALAAPLLGEVPWLAGESKRTSAGRYIDFSALSPAPTSR